MFALQGYTINQLLLGTIILYIQPQPCSQPPPGSTSQRFKFMVPTEVCVSHILNCYSTRDSGQDDSHLLKGYIKFNSIYGYLYQHSVILTHVRGYFTG